MNEKELLKKYGSPLYVYEYDLIKEKSLMMKEFSNKLEKELNLKISMHYSTKANGNPEILKIVKEYGLFVDAMSPLELHLAEISGFNKDDILYVCNNVTKDEMKMVSDKNILLCLDSVSQVETFGKVCPGKDIIVRINPGVIGVGHSDKVITSGNDTKFGISEESFSELFEVVNKYNLNIIGVHQHLGSLFLNDKIDDYIIGIKTGLELIKKHFKNLKIIDLGGGFGVPYKDEDPLDFDILYDKLTPVLKKFKEEYISLEEIKFEPGRFIVCEAGYILGTVTSIKENSNNIWIGTDIGMNILVRPSMYDAYHKIEILNDEKEMIYANICGNICESSDVLGKNRLVKVPSVGDVVKVFNAGAYGSSMISSYTGRLRPAEVMIYNDKSIKLIRKKETLEDFVNFYK